MRLFPILLGFLVLACSPTEENPGFSLQEKANMLGTNCYFDTDYVPIERSGNCIALLRMIKADIEKMPLCDFSDQGVCNDWESEVEGADQAYTHAIANSLWTHGKPSEDLLRSVGASPGGGFGIVYRNLDVMERLFERCLEMEREQTQTSSVPVKDSMLQLANSYFHPPLKEGQLCYREGYRESSET